MTCQSAQLASGGSISWQDTGTGPVVVLLAPIGLPSNFWDGVRAMLSCDYRLIAVDVPGFGRSAPLGQGASLDDYAQCILQLLDHLHVPEFVLMGCSIGGMIVQGIACQRPERVRGLILANCTATMPDPARGAILSRAAEVRRDMAGTIEPTIQRWLPPDYAIANPKVVATVRQWLESADPESVARGWEAIAGLDYHATLGALDLPLLIVTGSADPSAPPQSAHALAAQCRRAECMILEGVGHLAPLQESATFAGLVKSRLEAWQMS